jgi:hypothetical protein
LGYAHTFCSLHTPALLLPVTSLRAYLGSYLRIEVKQVQLSHDNRILYNPLHQKWAQSSLPFFHVITTILEDRGYQTLQSHARDWGDFLISNPRTHITPHSKPHPQAPSTRCIRHNTHPRKMEPTRPNALRMLNHDVLRNICELLNFKERSGTTPVYQLDSLSRTNKELREISTPFLFRQIVIRGNWIQAMELVDAMQDFPAVAKYTRHAISNPEPNYF